MDTNDLLVNTAPIVYDPDTGAPMDQKYKPLFDNLQGHILKDNGRDCAVLIFLKFDTDGHGENERKEKISNIKSKIADLARQITSTTKQLKEAAEYRTWRNERSKEFRYKEEELSVNFFLSANGYRALGFAENELPNDKSFRQGLGNMYFEATEDDHRIVLVLPELTDGKPVSAQKLLLSAKLQLILLQLQEQGITTEIITCPPRSCNPASSKKGVKIGQNRKRVRAELVDSVDALLEKLKPKTSKGSPKVTQKTGMLDFDPDAWEDEYENRIDALIVLGLDNERLLEVADRGKWSTLLNDEIESISKAAHITQVFDASIVKIEQGKTYYNRKENRKGDRRIPLEHFGFLDGVSNPLFLQKDIDDALKYEGIKKFDKYNPFAPLYTALVKDPIDTSAYGYGSYLVFLKMEQNVEAFDISVKALKDVLHLSKEDLAGAFVVGRFKDGTPVVSDSREGLDAQNNFTYHASPWDNDDEGTKCPFHAHIRKVNHRSSDWSTRLVRRGITYGDREQQIEDAAGRLIFDPKDKPTKDVGLLFMSFQSDIARQFETVVRDYVMKDVPQPGTGFDCLLGRGGKEEGQIWPERWGVAPSKEHRFPEYDVPVVSMKGGEYFFAPSISFLREIDNVSATKCRH